MPMGNGRCCAKARDRWISSNGMHPFYFQTWTKQDRQRFRAVTELAQRAFERFGEYREFIGQLMLYDGFRTEMLIDSLRCSENDEDNLAGFILVGIVPFHAGDEKTFKGNILAIALNENYRYKGLGGLLLKRGIRILQEKVEKEQKFFFEYSKVDSIELTVAPDNEPAVRLFTRFGFTFVPEKEMHYYASGVRACDMMRPLYLPGDLSSE